MPAGITLRGRFGAAFFAGDEASTAGSCTGPMNGAGSATGGATGGGPRSATTTSGFARR